MLESNSPRENEIMRDMLKIYRDNRVLWDPSHTLYYNRDARHRSLLKVLAVYRQLYPDATIKVMKKKIENMRNTYNKELKKVEDSIKTEQDPSKVYVPKLWYYDLMGFLNQPSILRNVKDYYGGARNPGMIKMQPIQEQETSFVEQPASSSPPPLKKLKTAPNHTAEELLGIAAEFFNSPESENEVLSKGWAMKLNKLSPDQRLFAEKIINDTLFEAQLGTLTRNGVRFLTDSESNSH